MLHTDYVIGLHQCNTEDAATRVLPKKLLRFRGWIDAILDSKWYAHRHIHIYIHYIFVI